MLPHVAIILGAFLLPSLATPTDYRLCPVACNCTNYVATCETVDFPNLAPDFLELRIMRSKQPISIDAEFFRKRKLFALTNLYIESSVINEINPMAFGEDLHLNSLNFVNCSLPELNADMFVYATSLQLLNIDQSKLKKIEPLKSESINQIKISNSHLTAIDIFDNLVELTDLNLSGNEIEKIDARTFQNLQNLEDLNLAHNNISELPLGLFDNNLELASVDLSGNPLGTIEKSSAVFNNLEQLILKNCRLSQFTGGEFSELVNLDLSGNLLTELPADAFANLTNLEFLDLSENKLSSLPSEIFANNIRLNKIVLDGNDFQRLPKFKSSEVLFTGIFSCNDCGLENIEADVFTDMRALITLQLSNNRLLSLDPKTFSEMKNLRVLDISYNAIKSLDVNLFEHNTALTKLNFAGNNIPYLDPFIFTHNRVLTNLDMSNNGMEEIWKPNTGNFSIPSLSVLNLADNKLKQISITDLKIVPNLKVLNINNNDLECTPEVRGAVKWLNMNAVLHSAFGMSAELNQDQMMTYTDNYWNDLYSTTCSYNDNYDSDDDDIEDDDDDGDRDIEDDDDDDLDVNEKIKFSDIEMLTQGLSNNWKTINEDDKDEYFDDEVSMSRIYPRNRYSFLWPLLVFMVTALLVLFMVTNVILCILRKRGHLPRNIHLTWKNGHNDFVYKPLTEDISRPRSIIINHIDKPETPIL